MNQQVTLVDIRARFPALAIDLKYASAGQHCAAIYAEARCLLHPDAAAALEIPAHRTAGGPESAGSRCLSSAAGATVAVERLCYSARTTASTGRLGSNTTRDILM